ncbi:MAG: PA14 domain-containing protein, partial [Actinomycetota bacterium]
SMNPDDFSVRWTGYLTVPATGSYQWGKVSDDGIRLWVNNALVIDNWVDQSPSAPAYFGSTALVAGQSVPVKIEYFEHLGGSTVSFWAKGPSGSGLDSAGSLVPASWLSADLPGLPDGWSMSADPDGELSYTHAKLGDRQVVLTDSTGATHTYTSTGSGWAPPPDEDGILATDPSTGLLVLQGEDGMAYNFASDGTLASVTSAVDDRNPAALQYSWTGTPARLTKITDPVSGRSVNLTYQTPGATACPVQAGYTTPPSYMLCKLDYSEFSAGSTDLFYSGGHLARILDPGSEITDFGYDSSGRLTQIRDPLTNDLIASGAIADSTADTHKTLIAYDAAGRATKVTAPVPDSSGTARPEHTYSYLASNKTNVSVAGLSPATGYTRQVTMDASNRLIEDRDSAGKLTSHTWDSQDRPTSSTDPAGLKTTTIYDSAGRPTDSYGPAAPSEFGADIRSSTAPHSTTAYDEGIDGMAAAWWDNTSVAGPPKAHTTLSNWANWGSGSPSSQLTADSFSGRLTGEINAPTAGNYGFSADVATDDGVRLFVDDKAVVERWDTHRGSVSKE